MIAYAVFTYTEATPFPGAATLLSTIGAALLIYVGRDHRTFASALLSARPMVAIGIISYSLYLVHWPIAVFTRYDLLREPDLIHILFIVLASVVLAVFSWQFIESPFRRPGGAGAPIGPVDVLQYRPFYILGGVERPGEYAYRPGMTVLNALSIAGGIYRSRESAGWMYERDAITSGGDLRLSALRLEELLARETRLKAEASGATKLMFAPTDTTAKETAFGVGLCGPGAGSLSGPSREVQQSGADGPAGDHALRERDPISPSADRVGTETGQSDRKGKSRSCARWSGAASLQRRASFRSSGPWRKPSASSANSRPW